MPMPDLPTSLMASFTTRNQTELRKLLELVYDAAISEGATFKFIEEQGDADDSGTILSTSEIVATVASLDGDITNGNNSVLVGGDTNTIDSTTNSVVLGGTLNTVDGELNNGILAGSTNNVNGSGRSVIVGGTQNEVTVTNNSVICGGEDNTISAQRGFIAAGIDNAITSGDCTVTGSNGLGDRSWSFIAGGGATTNILVQRAQAVLTSGGVSSEDETPAVIYFGGTQELAIREDTTAFIDLVVVCVNPANNDSYAWRYEVLAKRVGAAATVLVVSDSVFSDGDASLAGVTVVPTAAATGVEVVCTGIALTPLSFTATAVLNEQTLA